MTKVQQKSEKQIENSPYSFPKTELFSPLDTSRIPNRPMGSRNDSHLRLHHSQNLDIRRIFCRSRCTSGESRRDKLRTPRGPRTETLWPMPDRDTACLADKKCSSLRPRTHWKRFRMRSRSCPRRISSHKKLDLWPICRRF